mmetsp:Transcript_143781/g.446779  ORF Transcript_143781/g.446779 Transcript_143781/m.446779 type:complete len:210 (-) Transcript_143781:18-647(-)
MHRPPPSAAAGGGGQGPAARGGREAPEPLLPGLLSEAERCFLGHHAKCGNVPAVPHLVVEEEHLFKGNAALALQPAKVPLLAPEAYLHPRQHVPQRPRAVVRSEDAQEVPSRVWGVAARGHGHARAAPTGGSRELGEHGGRVAQQVHLLARGGRRHVPLGVELEGPVGFAQLIHLGIPQARIQVEDHELREGPRPRGATLDRHLRHGSR